jgi:hypothetical protein
MECEKCKKQYKSQKTLEQHIIRMHSSVEEVVPDETKDETKDELTSEHECNNCNKCKDELKYYIKLTDILYTRNRKLTEQVNILMTDFLKNKYIKDHNKENPTEQITTEDFDKMYKVIYPYVIPKEWYTDIINGVDTVIKEIYKDKNLTEIDMKEIIKLVKQKIK